MNRKKVILDVDTGIDDAMALAYASYCKDIDIILTIGSTGNTTSENAAQNSLNVLHFIKRDNIDVARGRLEPIGEKTISLSVHGKTGLGEYVFEKPIKEQIVGDIADIIHNKIKDLDEKIYYLCLGPATNFACLMKKYKDDLKKFEAFYYSGGLLEELKPGELPYLGFNTAFDPLSSEMFLKSGVPVYIIPSNLGHDAYLNWREVTTIKHLNKTGYMFSELFRFYHDRHIKNGIATHDLCALMAMTDEKLFEFTRANVNVKYLKELPSGVLDFDLYHDGKVWVATKINVKRAKRRFINKIKRMP